MTTPSDIGRRFLQHPGDAIRKRREAIGFTESRLAENVYHLGVRRLELIEAHAIWPGPRLHARIAAALECTVEDLTPQAPRP